MITLKLEAYLFSANIKHPESNQMSELIELFSKYELLPQYFEEQNLVTNVKNKRMLFTSPFSGYSVRFLSDKILLTAEKNPFDNDVKSIGSQMKEFLEFISETSKAYETFCAGQLMSNRISLTGNFITKLDEPEANEHLGQKISETIGWSKAPLSELMLRTGETERAEIIGEDINVVITVNDGTVEQNNNGHILRKGCLLINADLNTFQEESSSRFNVDTVNNTWQELSNKMLEKLTRISDFFDK